MASGYGLSDLSSYRESSHRNSFPEISISSQDLEDGVDKKGGADDYEAKLAEALFADDDDEKGIKDTLKTEDVVPDAFTTEVRRMRAGSTGIIPAEASHLLYSCPQVAEEFVTMLGEPGSLDTAWRVTQTLTVR
jgi:hypothetical protein